MDISFFDTIKPEAVRGKFYKTEDIDAILETVVSKTENMESDNATLEKLLERANERLAELTSPEAEQRRDSNYLILQAKAGAEELVSAAREEAEKQLADFRERGTESLKTAGEFYSVLCSAQDRLSANIAQAQSKLLELFGQEEQKQQAEQEPNDEELPGDIPEDLGEKISFLAREIGEIGTCGEEET